MRFLFVLLSLWLSTNLFSAQSVDYYLYNDPGKEFNIKIPKDYKIIKGVDKRKFFKSVKGLMNRKFDRFRKIYVFKNNDNLLIVKVYKNVGQVSETRLKNSMNQFERNFNRYMTNKNLPYNLKFESFQIKKINERKMFLFYGNGNYYLKNSSFVQGITVYKNTKKYIIYGLLKKEDAEKLDKVFLKSILSFTPTDVPQPASSGFSLKDLYKKKWFRYLILFAVAIAVTLVYNRYAKRKRIESLAPQKKPEDKNK